MLPAKRERSISPMVPSGGFPLDVETAVLASSLIRRRVAGGVEHKTQFWDLEFQMDATQVLIHYRDVEGRLDRRGRWSWALEGQSVTRGVGILVSRALVEIAHNGEATRASIQLRHDSLNRLNWIDPEVIGLRGEQFVRSSAESVAYPAGPTSRR